MIGTRELCMTCDIVWPGELLHKVRSYIRKDGTTKTYYQCRNCATAKKRKQRAQKSEAPPYIPMPTQYGVVRASEMDITEVPYNED